MAEHISEDVFECFAAAEQSITGDGGSLAAKTSAQQKANPNSTNSRAKPWKLCEPVGQ